MQGSPPTRQFGEMLIINADDWGGWRQATDSALACVGCGRITAVTAMVFMDDSERAAELAIEGGLDVGLHLNFTAPFTGPQISPLLRQSQALVQRFLKRSKYAVVVYHPLLRREFRYLYQAQVEEFMRLYSRPPSHVDGHQHKHLCANMLLESIIPPGQMVRRSFSFWPGEKGWLNRSYRRLVDTWLARRYRTTDFFFSLLECLRLNRLDRVAGLSRTANVELMTHPEIPDERAFLQSDEYSAWVRDLPRGTYA